MNINFRSIYFIIVAGSLVGLAYNFVNPDGIPLIKKQRVLIFSNDSTEIVSENKTTDENNGNQPNRMEEAKAIILKQAYELYNKNALFIDTRDSVEFEIGRIENAISLPYVEFDKYKSILDTVPHETPIVTYCDGKDCDLSILLGDRIFEMGYKEVYIFFGGWVDWQLAGYPIEADE